MLLEDLDQLGKSEKEKVAIKKERLLSSMMTFMMPKMRYKT